MIRRQESWLLVLVADRTEVATDDLKVCALTNIVLRHLEHPQMKVRDRAEGAACDEDYGLLVWVTECTGKAVGGERVALRVAELSLGRVGCHWRRVFGALAGVGGSKDGGKGERNMAGVGRGQIIISRSDDHRGRRHCAEVICSHANRRKRSPSGCPDSLQKTIQPSAQESLEISRSTSCKIRDEGGRCGQSDNCRYKFSKLSNLRRTLINSVFPAPSPACSGHSSKSQRNRKVRMSSKTLCKFTDITVAPNRLPWFRHGWQDGALTAINWHHWFLPRC